MGKNLIERLNNGPVLCAEGYLFAMERSIFKTKEFFTLWR